MKRNNYSLNLLHNYHLGAMSKTFSQIKEYARLKGLPLIPLNATDISLIREPISFYENILNMSATCNNRLALSSLYLGTEAREARLVNSIYENLERNRNLDVVISLDASRAVRRDKQGASSVSILSSLLNTQHSVQINLLNTNYNLLLSRLIPLPKRWLEVISTYHAKMLVFDNDVVLTGANLSNIYFEQRKDRYMFIRDSKHLSDYIFELLKLLRSCDTSLKESLDNYNFQYIKHLATESKSKTKEKDCDSFIVPLVQFGPAGLDEKEKFLAFLDTILPNDAQVHLSTGYFNPSQTVSDLRLHSVLAPSEQANGFFGGRGLLSYVPRLYSALCQYYSRNHPACRILLYNKPDWSFHAKGIWVEGLSEIYLHLIGSSNFNHRSANRDFEYQFLLMTSNKSLIDKLKNEREALWSESSLLECSDPIKVNTLYSKIAEYLRSYL